MTPPRLDFLAVPGTSQHSKMFNGRATLPWVLTGQEYRLGISICQARLSRIQHELIWWWQVRMETGQIWPTVRGSFQLVYRVVGRCP